MRRHQSVPATEASTDSHMDDWNTFTSQVDSLPEELLLERSADELLKRLESLDQHTAAPLSSAMSMRPPYESEEASIAGGSSVCSDTSSMADAAASRLYGQRKPRKSLSSSTTSKENGVNYVPRITARSKELIGDRDGEVGTRLHVAGKQAAARRQQAVEEARQQEAEAQAREQREAVPEINGVSSMLASGREGKASDRLFDHARESAKVRAERALEARREESASSHPVVSGGSERIVARMEGREVRFTPAQATGRSDGGIPPQAYTPPCVPAVPRSASERDGHVIASLTRAARPPYRIASTLARRRSASSKCLNRWLSRATTGAHHRFARRQGGLPTERMRACRWRSASRAGLARGCRARRRCRQSCRCARPVLLSLSLPLSLCVCLFISLALALSLSLCVCVCRSATTPLQSIRRASGSQSRCRRARGRMDKLQLRTG